MNEWIAFIERLPTRTDADDRRYVLLREDNGKEREGLYNWVPTVEYWRANGFTHWKPLVRR